MKKPKILIVEDEALLAMSMRIDLEDLGYEVCKSVSSGEEAVKIANEEKPDAVLMDIHLRGEMDGIEAAKQIKSLQGIPIIFITGYPSHETAEKIKSVEPIGYFVKPVASKDIHSLLSKVLGKGEDNTKETSKRERERR